MPRPQSRSGVTTTAQRPQSRSGVGLATHINVAERPVTQQGLSGQKTAGLGPARQVQDNSFYLQVLRAKCADIQEEIRTMQGQIDQGRRDNAAYGQLERKYETLSNDMRTLQARRRPAAARPPVAHSTRSPAAARRRAPSRT